MEEGREVMNQVTGVVFATVAAVGTIKFIVDVLSAKSKMMSGLANRAKGMTQKVDEWSKRLPIAHRRQEAKDAKIREQQRRNVQDYARRISGDSFGSQMLRRRAAGGVTGMLLNRNQAGQERQLQTAEDVLRKQRHEEAERAAKRMKDAGFRGDGAYLDIARAAVGSQLTSATGQTITVTEAEQQAAINNLVQQGRTSQVRSLESTAGPRTGDPNELHTMLDHAYEDYGSKLADKAPDLMPDRRTTEGVAAFTDLKPDDVSQWHHSTVGVARTFYNTPRTEEYTDPVTGLRGTRPADTNAERDQMLRAFAEASRSPATRAKLSLEQITQVREILRDAVATGLPVDGDMRDQINDVYASSGGTGPRI